VSEDLFARKYQRAITKYVRTGFVGKHTCERRSVMRARANFPFVATAAVLLALSWPVEAKAQSQADLLAGLPGFRVLVEIQGPDAERDGLSEGAMQTAVKLQLRQGGVRYLTPEEGAALPRDPLLYVLVLAYKPKEYGFPYDELYAVAIIVSVNQTLPIPGTGKSARVVTWQQPYINTVGSDNIRLVKDKMIPPLIDMVISAYLAANPSGG